MTIPSIRKKKEGGQAIVLVAITMVILIAFVGLAIDGGGAFLLYRDVQNATDSAALSAAFALCSDGDAEASGLRSAAVNGFVDPANPPPANSGAPAGTTTGTDVTVLVENPPTVGDFVGNDNYVRVRVSAVKPSYFIQVVYDGPLTITAETTSQCEVPEGFGWPENSAFVALYNDGCTDTAFRINGNANFRTIGGGIFINSENNSPPNCESADSGNANNTYIQAGDYGFCSLGSIDGPTITAPGDDGDIATTGDNGWVGTVTNPAAPGTPGECANVTPITEADPYGLDVPACGQNRTWNTYGSEIQAENNPLEPGTYSDLNLGNNNHVYLSEGIYCIDGGISVTGGTFKTSSDGALLYFTNGNGHSFQQNGGDIDITGLQNNPEYRNLMMWGTSPGNSSNFNIGGNGGFRMQGTVYVPFNECSVQGSGGTDYIYGQFVCRTLQFGGNGSIIVVYDPAYIFTPPTQFGVTE